MKYPPIYPPRIVGIFEPLTSAYPNHSPTKKNRWAVTNIHGLVHNSQKPRQLDGNIWELINQAVQFPGSASPSLVYCLSMITNQPRFIGLVWIGLREHLQENRTFHRKKNAADLVLFMGKKHGRIAQVVKFPRYQRKMGTPPKRCCYI